MPKRIIICADGTWNTPDQKDGGKYCPTNVVKISRVIKPTDKNETPQIVFYDQGVGTGWGLDRITGGAFGSGLTKNIEDCYRFIINNYEENDELFFFGFSRGAYTVRSLCGLIRNCGVLKKKNSSLFTDAMKLYRSDSKPKDEGSITFREDYSHEVRIKFIGVWDTVGSLGIPLSGLRFLTRRKYKFHDVQLSSIIDNAFHAVAVDEKRKPFKPAVWETKNREGQRIEQCWFSGVHSNVGGGYAVTGLSDIALNWMKEKADSCELEFDEEYLGSLCNENYKGELKNSKKGFFRLLGSYTRQIQKENNTYESLHNTAENRFKDVADYKPKTISEYLHK